jgi:hypothetical protein
MASRHERRRERNLAAERTGEAHAAAVASEGRCWWLLRVCFGAAAELLGRRASKQGRPGNIDPALDAGKGMETVAWSMMVVKAMRRFSPWAPQLGETGR